MKVLAQQGLASIEESLSRYDLLPATRQRLIEIYNSSKQNTESITALMHHYDITAPEDYQAGQFNPGDLSEYFDLVLRDWAWDTTHTPNKENSSAFQRIFNALKNIPPPKRILVLGAGAGRLSWDIHTHFKPEYSVALDSNPLLLAVANSLIHEQQSLVFGEFKNFPQLNFPVSQTWTLSPPEDKENLRATWFPLGANVWQLPFSDESFDLIITPWFIDVNGGDVRDLIGVISKKLVPSGYWINSGPLYSPVIYRYNSNIRRKKSRNLSTGQISLLIPSISKIPTIYYHPLKHASDKSKSGHSARKKIANQNLDRQIAKSFPTGW